MADAPDVPCNALMSLVVIGVLEAPSCDKEGARPIQRISSRPCVWIKGRGTVSYGHRKFTERRVTVRRFAGVSGVIAKLGADSIARGEGRIIAR